MCGTLALCSTLPCSARRNYTPAPYKIEFSTVRWNVAGKCPFCRRRSAMMMIGKFCPQNATTKGQECCNLMTYAVSSSPAALTMQWKTHFLLCLLHGLGVTLDVTTLSLKHVKSLSVVTTPREASFRIWLKRPRR